MTSSFRRIDKNQIIIRELVITAIRSTSAPLTGREISSIAGLKYKQTIDALGALYNLGMIYRYGKKFNTRWCSVAPPDIKEKQLKLMENAMQQIAKMRSTAR